jgi:hypothetical protein
MKTQSAGILRKIVGFRMDEDRNWIAQLECGHQKHVRNDPPYTDHHWVTTAAGIELFGLPARRVVFFHAIIILPRNNLFPSIAFL